MNFNDGLSFPTKVSVICFIFPFKNDEKYFYLSLYLKNSSHSQDIKCFAMNFWSCTENGLIKKIRLISKFMSSQPG